MDFGTPRIPQLAPGTGLLRAGLQPDIDRLPVDGTMPGAPGPITIADVTGLAGELATDDTDIAAAAAAAASAAAEADKPIAITLWIEDLPTADPAEPLYRVRLPVAITFVPGSATAEAEVAATAVSSLRLRKNGAANGGIAFTGTSGVTTIPNVNYAAGDLFEVYPPASVDATLDGLAITIPIA